MKSARLLPPMLLLGALVLAVVAAPAVAQGVGDVPTGCSMGQVATDPGPAAYTVPSPDWSAAALFLRYPALLTLSWWPTLAPARTPLNANASPAASLETRRVGTRWAAPWEVRVRAR